MKRFYLIIAAAALLAACTSVPGDGEHVLHILTIDDVHGAYFDSLYVDGSTRPSLMAVKYYADSVKSANGADNVMLLDAGDCVQGDNAAYYYNYIATGEPHIYPRLSAYLGTDAVAVGNHDVEPGHAVYDRLTREFTKLGIPFLAGNAIRTDNGKPYWPEYKMFKRAGLKVLVLGYTNPNMKAWLDEELWSGMEFVSLVPFVQERVDALKAKLKPDVTIVMAHSGTGYGDGSSLESQGLDLFYSLQGVDFVVCAHDHRPFVKAGEDRCILNAGNRAKFVTHGVMHAIVEGGKVVDKSFEASLIKVDKTKADPAMKEAFQADYEKVKAFTMEPVGVLECELRSDPAIDGMCNLLNLIHTVQLKATGAQLSFAAPLSLGTVVPAGQLIFNDMFKIYAYENQLFVLRLKGSEVKNYLEYSYEPWLNPTKDTRFYNFDSCAGLRYFVDTRKPYGDRVNILSLADGSAFDPAAEYTVAMTSYRASGGGRLLPYGAGVAEDDNRVIAKYPEIRNLIYDYIKENGTVTADMIGDHALLGGWTFMPARSVSHALDPHR